ncbi:hypothetical protein K449DRAFT_421478 [Hypoxylon sp. EC38]|nr:hypothetical protein K449DRAFT_421478 [Hypoxylon sp. EC38]
MASQKKSWILTGSTNYAVEGKIFLGQILSDALNPESALISGKPKKLPGYLHVDRTQTDAPVITSRAFVEKSGGLWLTTGEHGPSISAEAGLFGKSGVKWEVKHLHAYVTTFSLAYVKDVALKEADVIAHVAGRLNRWPTLYIITGVRIFERAKLVSTTEESSIARVQASMGGNMYGVPLQGGAGGQHSRAQETSQSFDETSDFVVAYQCNEINYFPFMLTMRSFTGGHTQSSSRADRNSADGNKGISFELQIEEGQPPVDEVEYGSNEDEEDTPHEAFKEVRYFLAMN